MPLRQTKILHDTQFFPRAIIFMKRIYVFQGSKFDRFSISRNLRSAVNFAKLKMSSGKKVLVCCQDGKFLFVFL